MALLYAQATTSSGEPLYVRTADNKKKVTTTDVTMDNNYPINGYALSTGQPTTGCGLDTVIEDFDVRDIDSGFAFQMDYANDKVKVGLFASGGGFTEVSNGATGLNGKKFRLVAIGS